MLFLLLLLNWYQEHFSYTLFIGSVVFIWVQTLYGLEEYNKNVCILLYNTTEEMIRFLWHDQGSILSKLFYDLSEFEQAINKLTQKWGLHSHCVYTY